MRTLRPLVVVVADADGGPWRMRVIKRENVETEREREIEERRGSAVALGASIES
jgi:hypothetical protein